MENLNILKPADDCCLGEKISVLKMQHLHIRQKKVDWRYFQMVKGFSLWPSTVEKEEYWQESDCCGG